VSSNGILRHEIPAGHERQSQKRGADEIDTSHSDNMSGSLPRKGITRQRAVPKMKKL
jgi:hypothetical protein